jgi:hypothetical protein
VAVGKSASFFRQVLEADVQTDATLGRCFFLADVFSGVIWIAKFASNLPMNDTHFAIMTIARVTVAPSGLVIADRNSAITGEAQH